MKSMFLHKDFEGLHGLKAVKDIDTKGRIITGYAAAFGNIDFGGDLIEPGAFSKTIAERGPGSRNKIFFLNQHDSWQVLGKPKVLKEDSYGLYHESPILNTTLGNDVLKMFQAEVLDSFSIGYRIITENRVDDVNHLKELYLYEFSSVTFPMNESAIATGIKSIDRDKLKERIDRAEKFCRTTDASDDTIELLLIQIKQLQQILVDLTTTTPPEDTTEPETQKDEDVGILIKKQTQEMGVLDAIKLFTV